MLIYILLFFVSYRCIAASGENIIKKGSVAKAIATWQTLHEKNPAKSTLRDHWFMPENLSPAEQESLIRTHDNPKKQLSHAMFDEDWSTQYTEECHRAVGITGVKDRPIFFYATKAESHAIPIESPGHIQAYGVGINKSVIRLIRSCLRTEIYYLLYLAQSQSGSLPVPCEYSSGAIAMQARLFASYYNFLFDTPNLIDFFADTYFSFLHIPPYILPYGDDSNGVETQRARHYSYVLFCRLACEHTKFFRSSPSTFKRKKPGKARQIGNELIPSICQDYIKEQEAEIEQLSRPDLCSVARYLGLTREDIFARMVSYPQHD